LVVEDRVWGTRDIGILALPVVEDGVCIFVLGEVAGDEVSVYLADGNCVSGEFLVAGEMPLACGWLW